MEKNVAVYAGSTPDYRFSSAELSQAIEWYLSLPSRRRKQVDKARKLFRNVTGMYATDTLVLIYQHSANL